MTKAQIKRLCASINSAYACGNIKKAEELQAKLYRHFEKEQQSGKFTSSTPGAAHMDTLVNRFD